MAANTIPIYPKVPNNSWATLTAANNTYDAASGTVTTLFTAGIEGSKVTYIKARALGGNVATVVRIFINNVGVTTTAANNTLFMERALAAVSASATAETADWVIAAGIPMAPNHRLLIVLGTTVAAGWQFTAMGGDY